MNAEGGSYENALLAALFTENKAIVKLIVYLITSAIDKGPRQKPSEHTIVLLGYIPHQECSKMLSHTYLYLFALVLKIRSFFAYLGLKFI